MIMNGRSAGDARGRARERVQALLVALGTEEPSGVEARSLAPSTERRKPGVEPARIGWLGAALDGPRGC